MYATKDLYKISVMSNNIGTDRPGFLWRWSVVECGGLWWQSLHLKYWKTNHDLNKETFVSKLAKNPRKIIVT
jgi:hypothetical protein